MKTQKFTLQITPNYSAKTFTIRKRYADGEIVKYRTYATNQETFDLDELNTENDWKHFLNKEQENYYKV